MLLVSVYLCLGEHLLMKSQLEVELNSYERVEEWINLPPEV